VWYTKKIKMKNKKTLTIAIFLFLVSLVVASPAQALRSRTRKKTASAGPSKAVSVSRGVRSQVRFRPDRRGLILAFSGFDNLSSVQYELVYDGNGVTQYAGGSINLGDTSLRELLFATCSGGVCTYHTNIRNARLSITSTLKDGTKVLKPYRIKV